MLIMFLFYANNSINSNEYQIPILSILIYVYNNFNIAIIARIYVGRIFPYNPFRPTPIFEQAHREPIPWMLD